MRALRPILLVQSTTFVHQMPVHTRNSSWCNTLSATIPVSYHAQPSRDINSFRLYSNNDVHPIWGDKNKHTILLFALHPKKQITLFGSALMQRIQTLARRFTIHRTTLPKSKTGAAALDSTKSLKLQFVLFLVRLLVETSFVASVLSIISINILGGFDRKYLVTNLTRWIVASLSVRIIMFHNWITSMVPSPDRKEDSDWFLQGSYHIISLHEHHRDKISKSHAFNEQFAKNTSLEGASMLTEVKIRQVPGNGSCLFHAIAASILFDRSISRENEEKHGKHPTMSKVIEYSSSLRTQAVDELESRIKLEDAQDSHYFIMQNDETISASELVYKAALQYGMSSREYLSQMRQENTWGGGPEIVALANSLGMQIILLEPISHCANNNGVHGNDASSIHLEIVARFGPHSNSDPIYILSTNQQFPTTYDGKKNNHFLAVFPPQK